MCPRVEGTRLGRKFHEFGLYKRTLHYITLPSILVTYIYVEAKSMKNF
jgi:hypothetical protein